MKKLPKLSEKLKKDKKLLLTVAAGILGIVFIVISEFIPKSSYKKAETGEQNKNTVSSYEETLEKRLESIISSVDGAGRVQVMVTLDTSEQTQYAKDEKENSKSGDKSSEKSYEKKYVLTDDDSGVVLKTTEPEVRGVIVVCDGGDNAAVKNGITSAVRAALSVDSNKITVLKNEKFGGKMMSATIKRKHLVLTGLVIALGTAMFVNWYYTKPEAKSVSKAADETTTVSANLGDAMYVNGTAAAAESDWLSEAKLKRTSAHDEAKSALEDVINSSDADSDSKQKASEGLEKLTKNITDESDIENLITAKLGGKCLVSLGESASVTVEKGYLTDEALTQIVDIVTAKSGLPSSKVTVVEAK